MTSARKIKIRLKLPPTLKPRNPLVAAALMRKAGSHQKTESALRRKEKTALKRLLKGE